MHHFKNSLDKILKTRNQNGTIGIDVIGQSCLSVLIILLGNR